jgi:uncharacterized protein (DUF1697 family)
MPRFVAFLRAINVGGHIVKMDRLRTLFEALPLTGVETFIASGNVIFECGVRNHASLEKKIESHLEATLGYAVGTFVRTTAEVARIAAHDPFPHAVRDERKMDVYVSVLRAAPDAEARKRILAMTTDIDEFALHERELYWLHRGPFDQTSFSGAALGKLIGTSTMRNVKTMKRLAAKYPA